MTGESVEGVVSDSAVDHGDRSGRFDNEDDDIDEQYFGGRDSTPDLVIPSSVTLGAINDEGSSSHEQVREPEIATSAGLRPSHVPGTLATRTAPAPVSLQVETVTYPQPDPSTMQSRSNTSDICSILKPYQLDQGAITQRSRSKGREDRHVIAWPPLPPPPGDQYLGSDKIHRDDSPLLGARVSQEASYRAPLRYSHKNCTMKSS